MVTIGYYTVLGLPTSKTLLVSTNPAQCFEDRDQQLAGHFGIITVSMLPEWNIA